MCYFRWAVLAACVVAGAMPGCSSSDKSRESAETRADAPLTVRDSIDGSISAKVKAIDHVTRMVTLADNEGHEMTFEVDPAVRRLNEVMVGDNVQAKYRADLVAELRPPTADEAANPISVVSIGARSPQGETPAAAAGQAVRVVTTVAAVDVPNMLVTLRGPMGDLAVVRGRKPENVKRLRVGDTIVITYAESAVVSLDKATAR